MRTPAMRLITSATFLFACALGLQQCSSGAPAETGSSAAPGFKAVASIDEVMESITIPSSQAIFDAVVYINGELTVAPQSEEEWLALRLHALAVAESGNLLMMEERTIDTADWLQMSLALNDGAMQVAAAVETRDVELLLTAGGVMYDACAACHEKYAPE
jgi:hypothetical protein